MIAAASPRQKFVRVAVNLGRPTAMTFTYRVPAGREVDAGEVVHVPWGARTLQGVVIEGPTDLPGFPGDIRELEPALDDAPRLDARRLALARWVADYYLAPAWESAALFLPPGAGEAPRTAIVRGPAPAPEALSERQAQLLGLLDDTPRAVDELRAAIGARGFEAALQPLVRRGLAERRYTLARPRGRARVIEVVTLTVEPEQARAHALAMGGRRASRRARALRALLDAPGPLAHAALARIARGAPAVDTLIAEGLLVRDGEGPDDEVRLAVARDAAEQRVRELTRTRAEAAAALLIERLAAHEEHALPVAALAREIGDGAREALRELAAAGLTRVEEVLDRREPLRTLQVVRRGPVELVAEQHDAARAIRAAIDRALNAESDDRDPSGAGAAGAPHAGGEGARGTRPLLLVGVTGSGKTEVYLDALQHAVERGRRGIVLVPEIALTPQTVRRFAERFPGRVGVLHSGLTLGEAFDEWHAIAAGTYDVVIGSRSAIFAPQPALGLIVVDEAHEWTYKQQDPAPRYDARTVARQLATLSGAALVLGTATPDADSWQAAAEGRIERVDLPRRFRPVAQPGGGTQLWPAADLPEVEVVDMRSAKRLFSDTLVRALAETLDRDEQAILFLNRRGFAGSLLCAGGHVPACSACDVALSLHDPPGRLVCHQCNRQRPLRDHCEECGRPLRPLRAGTQRVQREVESLFPTARVERLDRDTARTAEQHEAILGRVMRHEADVLVGTQLVAKGLDLPLVTLVGVVLADYSLWTGGFRAREQTFQLLAQVAGRAGRADRHGRVVVQTLAPEDRAILCAADYDVDGFFEQELPWRQAHRYPPFTRLVRLQFQHTRAEFALEEALRVERELHRRAAGVPDIDVLGPTPPPVARARGRHRWALLVRGPDPVAVVRDLDLPAGWTVDVDPLSVG